MVPQAFQVRVELLGHLEDLGDQEGQDLMALL